MKKLTVLLGIGLFVFAGAGITVAFARGMPCHNGANRSTMMQGAPDNSHHAGMMGWMHQMHGNVSSWWSESPARENTEDDRALTDKDAGEDESTQSRAKSESVIVLRTKFNDGMAYQGVSDEVENSINPTLRVSKGEKVTIRLINSMGGTHDLAIPALSAGSESLTQRGSNTTFEFVPEKTGEFKYYCTLPGHRSSGMEGTIVVE